MSFRSFGVELCDTFVQSAGHDHHRWSILWFFGPTFLNQVPQLVRDFLRSLWPFPHPRCVQYFIDIPHLTDVNRMAAVSLREVPHQNAKRVRVHRFRISYRFAAVHRHNGISDDLGRHMNWRAHKRPIGETNRLCQAVVSDESGSIFIQKDVLQFDVAVDDALFVKVHKRLADLAGDLQAKLQRRHTVLRCLCQEGAAVARFQGHENANAMHFVARKGVVMHAEHWKEMLVVESHGVEHLQSLLRQKSLWHQYLMNEEKVTGEIQMYNLHGR